MSDALDISALELGLLLGRGLAILALLAVLGWLVRLVPMPRPRKELLRAAAPLFALAVGLAFLVSAVQQIFGRHAAAVPAVLALLLVGFTAALWTPIRDLLAGVILKVGQIVREGDEVKIGEARGRVERLGHRGLVLRGPEGETFLPYAMVSRAAIVRASPARGAVLHTFRVRPVPGIAQVQLRQLIRESALLSHWSSTARDPEIKNLDQGAVEVSVFAVDAEFAPEIEAAVRRRLAAVEQARATEGAPRLSQVPVAPLADGVEIKSS